MKKSRIRPVWIVLGVTGVLGVVAFGIGYAALGLPGSAGRLAKLRAEAKREGITLRFADIKLPSLPAEQNAVPELRALTKSFEGSPEKKALDQVFDEMPSTRKPAKGDYLTTYARVRPSLLPQLGRLRSLADKPGYDFARDWSQGANVLFPEYAYIKRYAKWLCVEAEHNQRTGRSSDAWADLRRAARLSQGTGQEPTLISALVQIACQSIVVTATERVLQASGGTAEAIAGARSVLKTMSRPIDARFALSAEPAFGASAVESLAKQSLLPKPEGQRDELDMFANTASMPLTFKLGKFAPVREAFEARTIEFWLDVYRALPKDPEDYNAVGRALDNAEAKLNRDKNWASEFPKVISPVFSQIAPAMNTELMRRKALSALLDELERPGRALPIDAFGGGAMIRDANSTYVRIYSVGQNGVDDGGIPGENTGQGDIVAEFRRLGKR